MPTIACAMGSPPHDTAHRALVQVIALLRVKQETELWRSRDWHHMVTWVPLQNLYLSPWPLSLICLGFWKFRGRVTSSEVSLCCLPLSLSEMKKYRWKYPSLYFTSPLLLHLLFAFLHHTYEILPCFWKSRQKVTSEIRYCSPAEMDSFQMKLPLIWYVFQKTPFLFCQPIYSVFQAWNEIAVSCPMSLIRLQKN